MRIFGGEKVIAGARLPTGDEPTLTRERERGTVMGIESTLTEKEIETLNAEIRLLRKAAAKEHWAAADKHHDRIEKKTRGKTVAYDGFKCNWMEGTAFAVVRGGVMSEKYAA